MDITTLKDLRLEGKKVILTRWSADNIDKVVDLINNPKISENLLVDKLELTKESALQNVEKWSQPDMIGRILGICLTGSVISEITGNCEEIDLNKLYVVGTIGAKEPRSPAEKHLTELGYWIGEPFWGNGFVSEAVSLMTKHIFSSEFTNLVNNGNPIERIEACIMAHNVGSGKILQKNGFVMEGVQKKRYFKKGKFIDGLMYVKLRDSSN